MSLSISQKSCLFFAARYAHTRSTGASLQAVNAIIESWDGLHIAEQEQIIREAKAEATTNSEDWERLFAFARGELCQPTQ